MIDFLLGEFLEPNLIQPTFLYNYPRDISPLAKSMPGDPLTVERFEGYAAGFELCNAFTELNDPLDQEQLGAVMHLVFLDAQQGLEPRSATERRRHAFAELRVGDRDGEVVACQLQIFERHLLHLVRRIATFKV